MDSAADAVQIRRGSSCVAPTGYANTGGGGPAFVGASGSVAWASINDYAAGGPENCFLTVA